MNEVTRIRWQAGALLIAIYMAGTITGGALVYAGMRMGSAGRGPFLLQPGVGRTVIGMNGGLPIGYGDLDLTASQRQAIERIIAESRPHTDSILRMTLPALRLATDSMQARMRAVLTPDQRRRLDDPGPVLIGPGPPP